MAIEQNIVVLVGGVGGAKLALGLSRIVAPGCLTIVVNTADDFYHYGLKICPDLDTVMYTLSGVVDPVNGWGVLGDTTKMLDMMRQYKEDTWFRLGDRDLATHILRTHWLTEGVSLTDITRHLSQKLGIEHRILPMTDSTISTVLDTEEHGEIPFQTYFVKHRWQPKVRQIRYVGSSSAKLPETVRQSIQSADIILIGPSNPWLSIAPILSVPGMRALLVSRDIPRVAVTPIIDGNAIKGPAAKLMHELGYKVSATSVAEFYGDVINGFVYDLQDDSLIFGDVDSVGLHTIMNSEKDKIEVAEHIVKWIQG